MSQKLLAPFAAPTLGTWSVGIPLAGPQQATPLKLTQLSAIVIALLGATQKDGIAVYVSQNGSLTPSSTGLNELAPLAPLAQQGAQQAVLYGPNPVVAQFSSNAPPQGTFLYFYRVAGTTAIQIQVSGERDASSSPIAGLWNYRLITTPGPAIAAPWDWCDCDMTLGAISVTGPATAGAPWGVSKLDATSGTAGTVSYAASVGNINGLATQTIAFQWGAATLLGTGTGARITGSN